jgi:prepilin-type N-terminal cleavage/methylation domain-containing protein
MTSHRIHKRGPRAVGISGDVRGFSLIEMAVVLFVITLLIGSLLVPLSTQVQQRQISETQKALEEIKEALLGFAVSKGHLPCPDKTGGGGAGTANDGVEDVDGAGACVATSQGNVPWATLGVAGADPWGNRFRYQVTAAYAQRPATFNLSTAATLSVCTASGCPANTRLTGVSPDGAVAVIMSLGKNGLGAINANTGLANPAPASADENENVTGPTTFVSRTMTAAGSPAGEFDDIVTWLSKHTLFNRMVAAAKLP